jgi:hypothetical protein
MNDKQAETKQADAPVYSEPTLTLEGDLSDVTKGGGSQFS